MFYFNKAKRRASAFAKEYGYRLRRPWSFSETSWRLEWIDRNLDRLCNLALGRNPWHTYCIKCKYDLTDVAINQTGRTKTCPKCHEISSLPISVVRRNRKKETANGI